MSKPQCTVVVIAVLACISCAAHKPVFSTYRLIQKDPDSVLIPPGVAAEVAQRTFNADNAAGRTPCPPTKAIAIEVHKKHALVTVQREALLQQPPGWLSDWSARMESQGCLKPGAGLNFAKRIVESVPLDPRAAFRLLYPDQLEIVERMKIEVVSPILREASDPSAKLLEDVETVGNGNSLTVTVKSTADLVGYEIATYAVARRPNGIGLTIAPVSAERHIGAAIERRAEPATNYFRFPPSAAFYRVLYEAEQTEYAAVIVAARTRAELEQRTRTLAAGRASCEAGRDELCVAVPKVVAVNGFQQVTVNGKETMARWGATLGELLRTAGLRQPDSVLPKLVVYRPFEGKPIAVEFDRSSLAILNLILTGGEIISW